MTTAEPGAMPIPWSTAPTKDRELA